VLILNVDVKQPVSANQFDRLATNWIMMFVGNPRISVRLWNGNEYYFADGTPVAAMEFRDRSAMVDLIFSQRVGFGEGYSKGKIVIHGDILEFSGRSVAIPWGARETTFITTMTSATTFTRCGSTNAWSIPALTTSIPT
jgi:hypothetical protein